MGGLVIICLSVILVLAVSQKVQLAALGYITFIQENWGRGALLIVIGALFAETWGLWIANWVIFWFFGILFIVLKFVGGGLGGDKGHDFTKMPDSQ
jgi:hypothetical protein